MSKRRKWVLGSLFVVLAVTGGGYAVVAQPATDGGGSKQDRSNGLPGATSPVTRGDLSSGFKADGTLGFAKERKLNAVGAEAPGGAGGAGGPVAREAPRAPAGRGPAPAPAPAPRP
ncbi:hypothetical protein M8Z33_10025 [Streptomyces sp. ZAF1911]|uniref:hypothetical protein n=1 Tax=Streptomyces sp. ZAF1911 TaxID=2944129 RepID=UPI00237BCBDF|nr:hypothetical protein [Streptomyces sp. ZAF1911]MDD9376999.1 hypothetical protein [Streptomyces sp. ZAF1911]